MAEPAPEQPPSAEDRRRLRRLPLFDSASDETVHDLLAFTPIATLERHQFAAREGVSANSLIAVLNGRLALMAQAAGEQPQVLAMVDRGELMMPGAAIAGAHYPLTARAVAESRIACFPLAAIWAAADRDHRFAMDMARLACREWQVVVAQLKDHRLLSAPQRFAAYLVQLATGGGRPRSGAAEVELADDRKTLASLLGMTPENLSRTIAQFRERGVMVTGRAVSIADLASLADFANAKAI